MSRVLFILLFCVAFGIPARAQVGGGTGAAALGAANAQTPPTKKTTNGFCIPPGTPHYNDIKDFVPFVKLQDCLKSGGRLPPKR